MKIEERKREGKGGRMKKGRVDDGGDDGGGGGGGGSLVVSKFAGCRPRDLPGLAYSSVR